VGLGDNCGEDFDEDPPAADTVDSDDSQLVCKGFVDGNDDN